MLDPGHPQGPHLACSVVGDEVAGGGEMLQDFTALHRLPNTLDENALKFNSRLIDT